jgi:aryl-alcohol dehydrogenase-like predicted oxidoreductase
LNGEVVGETHQKRKVIAMKMLPLFQNGPEVSAICLGTMTFGTRVDEEASFALLDCYVEAGGRFLDTANCYAAWEPGGQGGESERLLGKWMKQRGNREDIFLATKVGWRYEGVDIGTPGDRIIAECDKSLERLGVECIDLYYNHNDDWNTGLDTPQDEILGAFEQLARAGKVKYVGASNFESWRLEKAIQISQIRGYPQYCCLQQRYTYLRPKPGTDFEEQIFATPEVRHCLDYHGLGLLAYSPLCSGVYTRDDKDLPPQHVGADSDARLTALKKVAAELDATANQIVLAWMLQNDPPILPIIGVSSMDQLEENLAALDVNLSESQIETLNNAGA